MSATNAGVSEKPSVKVYYDSASLSVTDILNVLLGIEEEGIPYDVQPREGEDLLDLAHHASIDSRIGVGIGISKEGIALQYEKLDRSAPLFKIRLYQKDLYRKIGSNAARLVKKMPFKSLA